MFEILALLGVCLVIGSIFSLPFGGTPTPFKEKCRKKPHLSCTVVKTINANGRIEILGGLGGCCMYKTQLKAMNKAFCQMVPAKDYNGMSINENVHKRALAKKEYYEKLDDSGPTEYE
jgi:hypothetical protein